MAPRSLLLLGAAAALSACAEPAIEMRLQLPPAEKASRFDVSCVTAVEVFARGEDRGDDEDLPADDLRACITIDGASSWSKLRSAIAGRFELALPGSGLAGVDVRGSTGTCKKDNTNGDTIFYASAGYGGGDELVLPMTPILSCADKVLETVRPVDLLALTRDGVCPGPLPDNSGGVDSIAIHPTALSDADWEYNDDFGLLTGGVVSLPVYRSADDASCAGLSYWENGDARTTESCVRRGDGVCSQLGQIELPIIAYGAAYEAADLATVDEYGGWVIGAVWGLDGTTRRKLEGATVRPAKAADAGKAKVVYAEYPAPANPRVLPGATATGASGLFIAYVGRPIDFIVAAPGYTAQTVRMGSPDEPAAALILLKKG